ncbi:c-type cytochrome [Pseudomonas luteola]|uniref:c-type cytochrome n=1 Tax=Pseudomonas luteola TaxID=47886 RepID=UPI00123A806A|nr:MULTISPECIES: c-type cytochrome [Pseudomonas]MBA1248986.1 cytochrome c4 [Pseudomonas zeshuii]QEU30687.1 cytochrome c4 [Pseudomonas luteola]
MKTLMVSLLLTLGISMTAQAAGDVAAGQSKSMVCGACHGPDGNSPIPSFPKIAGQGERYLIKQLHDIKSGARPVPEMMAFMPGLSDQDIEDLAAYFASQKPVIGAADPALVAAGEALYRGGRLETGLPACTGCHAPDGVGNRQAGFPLLSGQHAAYTLKQLTAFREGQRTNDGEAMMMRSIAGKLSDQDISALATYIEGLH